jgi:hypothetical protein
MCGAESQSPKAYCRRCGEWLPDIKGLGGIAFGGETPQQNVFTGYLLMLWRIRRALLAIALRYLSWQGEAVVDSVGPRPVYVSPVGRPPVSLLVLS